MSAASDHGHGYHTSLAIVIDRSLRWVELMNRNFTHELRGDEDEGEVLSIAEASNVDPELVRDVRDCLVAVDLIRGSI